MSVVFVMRHGVDKGGTISYWHTLIPWREERAATDVDAPNAPENTDR